MAESKALKRKPRTKAKSLVEVTGEVKRLSRENQLLRHQLKQVKSNIAGYEIRAQALSIASKQFSLRSLKYRSKKVENWLIHGFDPINNNKDA